MPNRLWKLPPYETKPIVDIVVLSSVPNLVHGYVNVRTNVSALDAVVEVSVDVSESKSLFEFG